MGTLIHPHVLPLTPLLGSRCCWDLVMVFILECRLQVLNVETAQGRGPHLHLLDKSND